MNELYTVIQLLATLAIGFVILGYSEFFTETLRTRFFHAADTISDAGKECISKIPDQDTLKRLKTTVVGSGNTEEQIKELKRKCNEIVEIKVPDFEKQAKTDLKEICNLHSIASMSLFVFMFTTTMLFMPCLRRLYGEVVPLFLFSFSSLCILYMVFGWILGERDVKIKVLQFGSMRHSIISFVLICIISAVWTFFALSYPECIGDSWKYFFVLLIIVGWLNFLMYALVIRNTVKMFKRLVYEKRQPLWDECNSLLNECNKLIAVMDVAKLTDSSK